MREETTSADHNYDHLDRLGRPLARPDGPDTGPPLLTSKLAVPPVPDRLVERPRLRRRLDAGTRGAVTLLAAPAGWGKSALLSSWAQTADPSRAIAWLSVEQSDDGDRFWSYLHAALVSRGTVQPLPAPATTHDVFLIQLADALARLDQPVVLVLDDFHHVRDADVLRGLEFLLRHAGTRLRLVIGTRMAPALPLHRWRVSGDLTELDREEFSFTPAETAELMANHGLALPAAQLAQLQAHTEGWPAGLRLAALALQGHPGPALRPDEVNGDTQGIADYLIEEVLSGQHAEIRDVLLHTSIVDPIFGELVDTLTGRGDGDQVLADLERRIGFLIPLGSGPPAYRYHRMFGELLRAELRRRSPEKIPELHRRAASWYAAHDHPADALRHALAAEDYSHATALLVEHWQQLVLAGPGNLLSAPPPPPTDAVRAEPELALAYAADRLNEHDIDTAEDYLQLPDRRHHPLPEGRWKRLTLITTALRLAAAQHRGDVTTVRSLATRILALTGPVGPARDDQRPDENARGIALTALGAAQLAVGDLPGAEETLSDGLTAAERAGLAWPRLACLSRLAFLRAARGELTAADRAAQAAVARVLGSGRPPSGHCAYAYLALAIVDLQRDRLDDAESHLNLVTCGNELVDAPALAPSIAIVRSQVLYERGDLAGSYAALRAGRRELNDSRPPPYLDDWFAAVETDLRTSTGDADAVRRSLAPATEHAHCKPALAVALARACLRGDDPHGATRLLPAWADDTALPLGLRLDAGIVEAQAARMVGDGRRVTRVLECLLRLAEPEGCRRVFTRTGPQVREMLVEHLDSGTAYWSLVNDLTTGTASDPVSSPPPHAGLPTPATAEPLTERELTVLRYLQSILSNVEIASELSLSVNTVKTHVRSIYRKLNTTRRRDAVRRARELHLI